MTTSQATVVGDTPRIAEFIDVASRLIAERGYDRTSVRDIARALNLTSGSMFYHFRTKDELLEAVIAKGIRDGLSYMEIAASSADQSSMRRFLALVLAHIHAIHSDLRYVHRVWIREWVNLPPAARARLRPLSERYRQTWDDILVQLKVEGELHSDPEIARRLLLPALNWTSAWAELPDEAARSQLAQRICAGLLNLPLEAFLERADLRKGLVRDLD